jgi:hypothetical protein
METSLLGQKPMVGKNSIVPTGFSPRFRAFEPGFPRSSPSAQGKSSISYALAARSANCNLRTRAIGTAPAIVQRTNKAMRELLARESVAKQVLNLGTLARSSTPDELKTHIAGEIAKWKMVREKAGIEQL